MPSVEAKEEIHKTSKIQRLNQEVDKWENMLTKLLSLPLINEVASKRSMNLNAWQYLTIAMRKQSKKIKKKQSSKSKEKNGTMQNYTTFALEK